MSARLIEQRGLSIPVGRANHAIERISEKHIVLFGGTRIDDLNDFWVFDIEKEEWRVESV